MAFAQHAGRLPQLVGAFRVGNVPAPLPWEPEGRAEANRARFINMLGAEWRPAMVEVDVRLRAELLARVVDVASGTGWSSIAMAQAYPNITVDAYSLSGQIDASVPQCVAEAPESGIVKLHRMQDRASRFHRLDLAGILKQINSRRLLRLSVARTVLLRDILGSGSPKL